ncbi:MAG: response regulator [Ardenticatenaceae bacterium]|nr:response regulator [Ardenticatenaceae bacterium]
MLAISSLQPTIITIPLWPSPDESVHARTVLIIDDEPIVRMAVADIFQELGFQTIMAANGEMGILRYQEHVQTIDLVILDYWMPGKHGDQVFDELRKINPAVKVIVSSGFLDRHIEHRLRQEKNVAILPKPYGLTDLLDVIHKLMR